jgi:diacylglycerol kinase (ATP)
MHAAELAREGLRNGYERLIAVGGDGTLHEVLNGFFDGDTAINPDALLAMVTSGTGGDVRRTLGIDSGTAAALARLRDRRVVPFDVGRVSYLDRDHTATRYFANVAGFGLSGAVDVAVNGSGLGRLLGGRLAFAWSSLRTMLTWQNQVVRLRIDDSFDEVLAVALVAVANCRYFGGGMQIAPNARFDDGLFDIVIVEDASTLQLMHNMARVYSGSHLRTAQVRVVRGRSLRAEPVDAPGAQPLLLDIDGESPGRLPAHFDILPRALRMWC